MGRFIRMGLDLPETGVERSGVYSASRPAEVYCVQDASAIAKYKNAVRRIMIHLCAVSRRPEMTPDARVRGVATSLSFRLSLRSPISCPLPLTVP